MRWLAGLLVLLGLITLGVPEAQAHERSRSNSIWQIEGGDVRAVLVLDARQATLFLSLFPDGTPLEEAYRRRLVEGVSLERGGEACAPVHAPTVSLLPDGRLRGEMSWSCARPDGVVEMDVRVFLPFSPNHMHFLTAHFPDGQRLDAVLTQQRSSVRLDPAGPAQSSLARLVDFVGIGLAHILGGLDHLAFLAALMLVVRRWRRLLVVTLGFTLGHSVTLGLAVLGWIDPPGLAIEALIGFSVLFLAAEAALTGVRTGWRETAFVVLALIGLAILNLTLGSGFPIAVWLGLVVLSVFYLRWMALGGDPAQGAPVMSAGFGLVHGVGFAGILLELELPLSARWPALLGFNLGVEIGQLAFVAGSLGLMVLATRWVPNTHLTAARPLVIGLLALIGTYWFVARSLA